MKKGINKIVRWEFEIRTNTKILEKNPTKGGTPAKESKVSERTLVKTLVDPKLENEKRVLIFVPADCRIVVKSKNEVRL